MKIIRNINDLPTAPEGGVVAIGNFDGVHKGHQAVLAVAQEEAKKRSVISAVMTFEPHPRQFFAPDKPLFRLTDEAIKLEVFEALGIDVAVVLRFDEALAALSAEEFVRKILVDGLKVGHVVTGFDFFFGKGREGSPEVMRRLGEKLGFGVTIVDAKSDGDVIYSSSIVREALRQGAVEEAARYLGRWWRVHGKVESGAQRGRDMGFPTVNLSLDDGQGLKHGIYAARVFVDGARYYGAAYMGTRPTFDDGLEPKAKLEVYLFDFEGDLYGKDIAVEFIKYLRGDASFDNQEALAKQIIVDCEAARVALGGLENEDPLGEFYRRG